MGLCSSKNSTSKSEEKEREKERGEVEAVRNSDKTPAQQFAESIHLSEKVSKSFLERNISLKKLRDGDVDDAALTKIFDSDTLEIERMKDALDDEETKKYHLAEEIDDRVGK